MAKRRMRLTDFMSGKVTNRKVADEIELQRTVKTPNRSRLLRPPKQVRKRTEHFRKSGLIKFPWLQESDGSMKCVP